MYLRPDGKYFEVLLLGKDEIFLGKQSFQAEGIQDVCLDIPGFSKSDCEIKFLVHFF